jgi:HTH-type transcriptional regulator / antitoxin HigA
MDRQIGNEYRPVDVSPPGATLRDLLDERGITQVDLASRMGRPQKTISEIANGKAAITPETALELELVLGVPAEFWVARERDYRTYLAKARQARKLQSDIAWVRRFPVSQMVELGWLRPAKDAGDQVKALLEFFGVASVKRWEAENRCHRVAFRRPRRFAPNEYALSAWLRTGIAAAESQSVGPYRREAFLAALSDIKSLTMSPPQEFQPKLTDLCAKCGVVVAFVPELPRSRACGATMWLGASRALIQLSLRYKTDDHLWFTFFHESAHVLFHEKSAIFIETDDGAGRREDEANRWAADFLIPGQDYYRLTARAPYCSRELIRRFAADVGVAPGIVVGRLQHDGLLPRTHCNALKRRFQWSTQVRQG